MKIVKRSTDLLIVLTAVLAMFSFCLAASWKVGFATISSESMSPAFKSGDTVVTRQSSSHSLSKGDVIVFPHPDNTVLSVSHRVISKKNIGGKVVVKTKGDANPKEDSWQLEITSDHVRKVIGVLPTASLINTSISRSRIFEILIYLSLFMFLIGFWRLIKSRAGV